MEFMVNKNHLNDKEIKCNVGSFVGLFRYLLEFAVLNDSFHYWVVPLIKFVDPLCLAVFPLILLFDSVSLKGRNS